MLRLQHLAARRQQALTLEDWQNVPIAALSECFADSREHLAELPATWSSADVWAVTRVPPHLYACFACLWNECRDLWGAGAVEEALRGAFRKSLLPETGIERSMVLCRAPRS